MYNTRLAARASTVEMKRLRAPSAYAIRMMYEGSLSLSLSFSLGLGIDIRQINKIMRRRLRLSDAWKKNKVMPRKKIK